MCELQTSLPEPAIAACIELPPGVHAQCGACQRELLKLADHYRHELVRLGLDPVDARLYMTEICSDLTDAVRYGGEETDRGKKEDGRGGDPDVSGGSAGRG